MEVNGFEVVLIDVTLYVYYVQKLVCNVLIKTCKKSGLAVRGLPLQRGDRL